VVYKFIPKFGTTMKGVYTADGHSNTTGSQLWPIIALQYNTAAEDIAPQKNDGSICPTHGVTTASGPASLHCRGFTITLTHPTLGRTPLDEWSARCRDLYLTTLNRDRYPCPRRDSNSQSQQAKEPTPQTARLLGSSQQKYASWISQIHSNKI